MINWALVIGVVALLIVIADIAVFARYGREATLSRFVQRWGWSAHPLVMIALGVVIGGLIVHFFGWEP